MKILVRALVVMFCIFSVAQSIAAPASTRKTPFEDSAAAVLKRAMAPADYARLNWKKAVVVHFNNTPAALEIPDENDTAQHLVFTYISAMPVYHWVKYVVTGKNKLEQHTGLFILTDVQNHVFRTYTVENLFVTGAGLSPLAAAQPIRLQSTYPNYWFNSLYWAFNQNDAYKMLYSGVGYPTEDFGAGKKYKTKTGVPGQTDIINIFSNPTRDVDGATEAATTVTSLENPDLF